MRSGVFELEDDDYEDLTIIFNILRHGRDKSISENEASPDTNPELDSIERFSGFIIKQRLEQMREQSAILRLLELLEPGTVEKIMNEIDEFTEKER